MDPVSQLLLDRERAQPRLLPWVVAATVLHGSVAGAMFLFGRAAAARPVQLPVVSVKLVRPEQRPARRPAGSRPQATPVPQPTAIPTPAVERQPTAVPEQRATASVDAMPEARATPAATPPAPQPSTEPGGRGLSLGDSGTRQIPGIPADFHFTYYIERMLALIESRWYKPAVPPGTRARVRFRILRDGRVEAIDLEEGSGQPSFDRAALRALYATNPLPPLPPAYSKPSLTVHLTFSE